MNPMRPFLAKLGLAALALAAFPLGAAQAQFADCGTIEQGVTCPKLFRDSTGMLWLLNTYGSFQVGDTVFVTGVPDPQCISICQQGNGCIHNNTIQPCDPTAPFCFC